MFTEHEYRYEERGGTAVSSRALGVDEHAVIKTLVMEDEEKRPLIVLMHGDREVSTKNLARQIGRKAITPCAPDVPVGRRRSQPPSVQAGIDRRHLERRRPRAFLAAGE